MHARSTGSLALALALGSPCAAQVGVVVVDGEVTASGFAQLDPVAGWQVDFTAPEEFQGLFANSFFDVPSVFAASSETSGGLIGVPTSARGTGTLIANGTISFGGSAGLFFDFNFEPVLQVDGFSLGEIEVPEPTLLGSGSFDTSASGRIEVNVLDPALVVPDAYDTSGYDSLVFEEILGAPIDLSGGPVAIPAGSYRLSFFLGDSPTYPADFPDPPPLLFGKSGATILVRFTPIDKCAGDANFDGTTNFADVTTVLNFWLDDYGSTTGPGDADRNGVVNFGDISSVLGNWLAECAI